MKKLYLVLAGILVLSLALAACAPKVEETPAEVGEAEVEEVEEEEVEEVEEEKPPILIGNLQDESGGMAVLSTPLTYAATMKIEEINAAGGVTVGGTQRPFAVESIDIRDAAPGVPVPEALLGLEKIILEKKPAALLIGPFRSEALMAGMDLIAKYKVPMLGTIAMTPAMASKVMKDPAYRYIFRTGLDTRYLADTLIEAMRFLDRALTDASPRVGQLHHRRGGAAAADRQPPRALWPHDGERAARHEVQVLH